MPDPKEGPAKPSYGSPKEGPAKLSYFKLEFINQNFPVLGFLYALVCGGEHAIYCDFTEEYARRYLIGKFWDDDFKHSRAKLAKVLSRLDADRGDPAKSEPTPEEWTHVCEVVAEELKRGTMPKPIW